jgi:hypothetical protein
MYHGTTCCEFIDTIHYPKIPCVPGFRLVVPQDKRSNATDDLMQQVGPTSHPC